MPRVLAAADVPLRGVQRAALEVRHRPLDPADRPRRRPGPLRPRARRGGLAARDPRRVAGDHALLVGLDDSHGARRVVGADDCLGAGVSCPRRCGRPRCSRPRAISARTTSACSPMPPVKTSVSRPPTAAAMAPTHFRALHVKTSIAIAARGSLPRRARRSRTSAVVPLMPSRPDRRLTSASSAFTSRPLLEPVNEEPGVDVSEARAHHEAAGGREAHRGVDGPAVAHGRHARSAAQVRQHRAPQRGRAPPWRRRTRTTVRESRSDAAPRGPPGPAGRSAGRPRKGCGETRCRSRPPAVGRATARPPPRRRRSPAAGAAARRARAREAPRAARRSRAPAPTRSAPPCTMRWPTASGRGPPRASTSSSTARTAAAWSAAADPT